MLHREFVLSIVCIFFVGLQANWSCQNGEEVIEFSQRCDARVDCSDGSDETFSECYRENCTEHQCSYGGCFSEGQLCDGTPDCWDKTDEHPQLCRNTWEIPQTEPMETFSTLRCLDNQRQCPQTDECLDKKYFCDGIQDCPDGSDETNGDCIADKCPKDTFRCAYGGCLAKARACDHKIDCWDGTDEVPAICFELRGKPQSELWPSYVPKRNATRRTTPKVFVYPEVNVKAPSEAIEPTPSSGSCIVPGSLKHLHVKTLFNVLPYTSGSAISDSVVVRLSCQENRELNGNDLNHCLNGTWQGPWPECLATCSHRPFHTDLSTRAHCSYKGEIRNCKSPDTKLFIGTTATVSCAPSYKPQRNITSGMHVCQRRGKSERATWKKGKHQPITCIPDCGKILPTVKLEPWLVGIFKSDITLSNYTHKCNGTIISPWLVIADRDCIDEENLMRFVIAEGYHYWHSFGRNEEHPYRLHNIASSFNSPKHTALQLVNPFILSASVRPICLPPVPRLHMRYSTMSTAYITTAANQKIYYFVNIDKEFFAKNNKYNHQETEKVCLNNNNYFLSF